MSEAHMSINFTFSILEEKLFSNGNILAFMDLHRIHHSVKVERMPFWKRIEKNISSKFPGTGHFLSETGKTGGQSWSVPTTDTGQ